MNLDALHALTLDAGNSESSVTVNQRALIDKVLSRYSSENTLLRELLQNSDDANATSVTLTYESSAGQPDGIADLHRRMTKRVVVKNNGQIFRPEDWSRLSRIAEGNPDEAKIGAFGVGFYSVFSICEDPFVTSGDTGLAFYWRKDQLFTRSAKLPTKDDWTTFALNMRQESELPQLKNLTKFLATSLTFSRSLKHIELWLDNTNLCTVDRTATHGGQVAIPSQLTTITSGKMLKITSVDTSSVQINATYLESTQALPTPAATQSRFLSLFSSTKDKGSGTDPSSRITSKIFLRVLTGHITSSVNKAFSTELQRATKKPPPKTTKLELVAINAAEYNASTHTAPIFENLLTFPHQGRVYIGFPTHQTTGFSGHVGAPCIIPTVERESIDLVDRFIKLWNFEVLRAIGLMTRIAYHTEFLAVESLEDAIHTTKFFSMLPATPQNITQTVEAAFFESSNVLPVFSSAGVRPSNVVRLSDPKIKFLQNTPVLPASLASQVPKFVERLENLGYVEYISIGDIKKDLLNRVLDVGQAISFLTYCASISKDIDRAALSSLLQSGVIVLGNKSAYVNLGQITSYPVSKILPEGTPLPKHCLPTAIASTLGLFDLQALGWHELSVLDWLNFIVNDSDNTTSSNNICTNPDFAAVVLATTSKNFDNLATEDRTVVIDLLRSRTCMPTKNHGMCRPDQTYFHTIKLFDDLPLILTMKGVKERFLVALGVRKTIELDYIFKRLQSDREWTLYDLIVYLASIRKDIPSRDMERLKITSIAKAEGSSAPVTINSLYEPIETLRSLSLPIIAWPAGRWRSQSEESYLLTALGLRRIPPVNALLHLASKSPEVTVRERALNYFIMHFVAHNYGATYDARTTVHMFVPAEGGSLELPRNVSSEPACGLFGLAVLRKDLTSRASLLGVTPHPAVEILIQNILRNPTKSYAKAVAQFSYIATLNPTFSKADITERIGQVRFIPIEKNGTFERFVQPQNCFFRQDKSESVYAQIFDCVDFGAAANQFLRSIGVRDEPSSSQIAGMLVKDASNVWAICGSEEKYKSLLTQLARDSVNLKKDKSLWQAMRQTRLLLAYRYVDVQTSTKSDLSNKEIEETAMIHTSLQRSSDIVVVDDMIFFNSFRNEIYSAPQEQYIEEFYRELGAPLISSITIDRPLTSGRMISNETTDKLKAEVLERLTVFLSESRTKPKRDIREVTSNLSVVMQEKVACQRELTFGQVQKSKYVEVSAVTKIEGRRLILVVTKSPDRYDIAVALCKVVLTSARPGDYLLLETLLTNTLRTLKARGYPVDRILQRQEREKREQQVRYEEEQKKNLLDSENRQHSSADKSNVERPQSQQSLTPQAPSDRGMVQEATGVLSRPPTTASAGAGGFMANIKKGLGLNQAANNAGDRAQNNPRPVQNVSSAETSSPGPVTRAGQSIQSRPAPNQAVTSQASISQALQRAIKMSRTSDNTNVFSSGVVDQVREAKSFCDAKPAQDLVLAATLPDNTKFFVNRHLDSASAVQTHMQRAIDFSRILLKIGAVYRVNYGSINICYDPNSPTIAFNMTGTIYCNLHFYNQLHSHRAVEDNSEAYIYWYVTLAHELAHNLVSEHSSEHEFYMESMIAEYMGPLIAVLGQLSSPPTYASTQ